jgi:hypothetical protein
MEDSMSNNFESTSPPAPLAPEPASNTSTAPASRRKWLTPVLALLAVLVIGLFGGVLIGHATASSAQASNANGLSHGTNGGAGGVTGGAGLAGGGLTAGTIVSVTGTTMVIKAQDGTTKTIRTSGTTRISKTTKTTLIALKAGQKVTVVGVAGSNGDIAATSVSEGTRGFGAQPGGGGTGAPESGSTDGTNG